MKRILLVCSLFIISMSACNRKAIANQAETPLVGTFWQLSHAGDFTYQPNPGVRLLSLKLESDNKINGFLGCNKLGGSYETSGKKGIKFTAISTKMACSDMSMEDRFNKALIATQQYKIEGNVLSLMDENGVVVADFVAVKS